MKVIFALGNPGLQYARTRHNTGFLIVDALAAQLDASWHTESKFKADIATVSIDGQKTLLVKPLSFYNDVGTVARSIIDFYKLDPAQDFLAIHDELALPFGTIRIRENGSDAGNNGIKSLNSHLGANYARIRIGVWNELRDKINDADFVLSAFTKNELEQLTTLVTTKVHLLIESFIAGSLEPTSHTLDA